LTELDAETARRLLRYDSEAGKLFWRERTPDLFKDGDRCKKWRARNWNSNFAEKEAFTADNNCGYKHGRIFFFFYFANRIIWLMIYDQFPPKGFEIDHINGDRKDNRIKNLRLVTRSQNNKNRSLQSNNTSGYPGVIWYKSRSKWYVTIKSNSKDNFLGYFTNKEEAIAARKKAEKEFGFHENHGRERTI